MSSNSEILYLYFIKIRQQHRHIDEYLQIILRPLRSPHMAICIAEIKERYRQLAEEDFPIKYSPLVVQEFLLTIPYIACYCNEHRTPLFYSLEEI
ncbi:maternal effect protein oskar-like [Haematobia irritans]|uniref:maternal effect protein oskar-like n=1 Tax=Haematobia irritans TaxID=7368 RepID=UPI003F504A32